MENEGGAEFVYLVSSLLGNGGTSLVEEPITEVGGGRAVDCEQ